MSLPARLFKQELEKALTYRFDFVMRVAGKALSVSLISWFLWSSIFSTQGRSTMAGWELRELLVYYAAIPLTLFLVMNSDFDSLSTEIYDGSLSRSLLYPRNYLWMNGLRKLASGWITLLPYGLLWAGGRVLFPENPTASTPLAVCLFYVAWCTVAFPGFYLLATALDLLAFWFEQTWSLRSILRFTTLFLGGGFVPVSLFPEGVREIFLLFPSHSQIGFATEVLARGRLPDPDILLRQSLLLGTWTLIAGGIVAILWKRGLKEFSGSGL
jgi:ABC-2 type transport system permease protein